MSCEAFSEKYVQCIREGGVVPDEFLKEGKRRVEASRKQGLGNPEAWARLIKPTHHTGYESGVILDNDHDRQAAEELGLSDMVRGSLSKQTALEILQKINRRADQLRTYEKRGYGSTEE